MMQLKEGAHMLYGDKIKQYRKHKNYTQKELAAKAGIAINSLRRYEANERCPNVETLSKIAEALDVNIQELLFHDPQTGRSFFWTADLEERLKDIGYTLVVDEDNAALFLSDNKVYFEVTEKELARLYEKTNSFMLFLVEEIKKQHTPRELP